MDKDQLKKGSGNTSSSSDDDEDMAQVRRPVLDLDLNQEVQEEQPRGRWLCGCGDHSCRIMEPPLVFCTCAWCRSE